MLVWDAWDDDCNGIPIVMVVIASASAWTSGDGFYQLTDFESSQLQQLMDTDTRFLELDELSYEFDGTLDELITAMDNLDYMQRDTTFGTVMKEVIYDLCSV